MPRAHRKLLPGGVSLSSFPALAMVSSAACSSGAVVMPGDAGACWAAPGDPAGNTNSPGVQLCGQLGGAPGGGCVGGTDNCTQLICSACTFGDGEALEPAGFPSTLSASLGESCPAEEDCSLAELDCLSQNQAKILSPSCAAAFASLFEQQLPRYGDAGANASACNPEYFAGSGDGTRFCSVIGDCVGGSAYCEQVICPACSAVDGLFLSWGKPIPFFGGSCPAFAPTTPCAELECLIDAGLQALSPSCAAAVTSLAELYFDGGLDAG